MANYVIRYNPYQNETEVVKDGTTLRKNSKLCKKMKGRLQAWEKLGEALEEDNNEPECYIDFVGREIDFIDLKNYFEHVYRSEKTEFILEPMLLSNDDDMLSKLSGFAEDAKKVGIFNAKQVDEIKKHIEKIKAKPFVISVIATMSSGKSTLLNSLMHMELLPTGDKATTANIVEIYDNDKETMTYCAKDKEDRTVREGSDINLEMLAEMNKNEQIHTVEIYGNIPGVDADKMQLMLRDTPGPNNSGDSRHREKTEEIISDVDMSAVIYVMNATQLEVDSDEELLRNIADEMKKGGKQANDRFLFVINKVDDWIENKEQTLEGLEETVREYLSRFEIHDPRIFPVTAGLARTVWRYRSGYEFTKREKGKAEYDIEAFNIEEDEEVKFDLHSSVSQCVRRQLDIDLEKAIEKDDKCEIALIHSGIKGLEYSIKEYVEKYAYPIKVSDAVNDIIDTIEEKKMRSNFKRLLSMDENKRKKIEKQIKESTGKKTEGEAVKARFEKDIKGYVLSDEIKNKCDKIVEDLFDGIVNDTVDKLTEPKIRQDVAKSVVDSFSHDVETVEKKLDERVKKIINEEIYEKGEKILSEFKKSIQKIKDNSNIEGFDFGKVKDLKKFDFGNIRDVVKEITSTEDITREKKDEIPNPDKHWYTPWRPKFIEKITVEKIGTIEYVNKAELRWEILRVKIIEQKNVKEIISEAGDLIAVFKKDFKKRLEDFNGTINSVLAELENSIKEEETVEKNKKKHEEDLRKLEEYMGILKKIVDMGE